MPGSSPLARGLPQLRNVVDQDPGIIPARAGFTPVHVQRVDARWDHPRSRGVYAAALVRLQGAGGSSPLARGLRGCLGPAAGRGGIIPARAGFTQPGADHLRQRRDHPRSRGVYYNDIWPMVVGAGSSPLARGLRQAAARGGGFEGIIPARAGFTRAPIHVAIPSEDHPRSRGVYLPMLIVRIARPGSSPLARGLLRGSDHASPRRGIIPARAGFTAVRSRRRNSATDHPRSRGVYEFVSPPAGLRAGSSPLARGLLESNGTIAGPIGSSPLARGLLYHRVNPLTGAGIIPARAGFTLSECSRRRRPWDHPRSRGVYCRC